MSPAARRRRAAALAAAVPLSLVACILHTTACGDDGAHVYTAELYVQDRDCLGTTSSIDIISGDETGDCSPICLVQLRGEAGRVTYVSTMCPPYPAGVEYDSSGTDPSCPAALAALARGDTCFTDGGSSHPIPPPVQDAAAE
jgi:hypothetical protein